MFLRRPNIFNYPLIIFRAINYDEKDPFLCHACGFCKYAKFDFTITGRACCAVDPIENDDDSKFISLCNTFLAEPKLMQRPISLLSSLTWKTYTTIIGYCDGQVDEEFIIYSFYLYFLHLFTAQLRTCSKNVLISPGLISQERKP